MHRIAVTDHTLVTALGIGRENTLDALREGRTGLSRQPFETVVLDTWLGAVDAVDGFRLQGDLAAYDCRNNRLAELTLRADGFDTAVHRARDHHGADRIGVFVGTSTSAMLQTEQAYRRRDPVTGAMPPDFRYAETHNSQSVVDYTRRALGLGGPAFAVSTACSSGAKAYAVAARMLALGLIDAAVVGGVDTLCLTTLCGFDALQLLSPDICRPWDAGRRGLSVAEAGAFALLERDDAGRSAAPRAWLLGIGESSDGHHMSTPHPSGAGAADAMRAALASAAMAPSDIGYLNLHGTATPSNDSAEDLAVTAVFGDAVPCSSTKGATGHTLGAAGAVEASIALLALADGMIPGGINRTSPDLSLRSAYVDRTRPARLGTVASNSFGFGGSNACLVFGAAA